MSTGLIPKRVVFLARVSYDDRDNGRRSLDGQQMGREDIARRAVSYRIVKEPADLRRPSSVGQQRAALISRKGANK